MQPLQQVDTGKQDREEFVENISDGKLSNPDLHSGNEDYYKSYNISKIIRKMDLRILPVMSALYLMSFLDRTNIGNARIAGMVTDLKLRPAQYNWAVTSFFFTYFIIEAPSNLMLKKFGAKIWLPFIMVLWAACCLGLGFVTNYTTLLITRLALGLAEGGLFPGVAYYLTTWYPRSMIAFRIAIFFSAATIAGGFGGLLAYGFQNMNGLGGKTGWEWIFIMEGLITFAVAILGYFLIPESPSKVKWLNQEERDVMSWRIAHDGDLRVPMDDSFRWAYVGDALTDWKLWLNLITYWGAAVPLYSVALTLPSIVRGMGYTSIDSAQLHTVPVYIVGCVFVVLAAWVSDRWKRSPVVIIMLCIAVLGWGLALGLPARNNAARYTSMFFACIGSYGSFVPQLVTLTSNVGGKTKRATAIGIQVGVGGLAGGVPPWLFRASEAPNYPFGCKISMVFAIIGIVSTSINWFLLTIANKRKDEMISSGRAAELSDKELSEMGDRSPYFRYSY
ncbi:major facilitator superfamily domain-containing protein [Protomyces lactucae-debilis]|uniref:Major facilitator superfamily domain-containing protein n=1 Tax=Protomyces lactucae-debilis TaxID=2754530 RepID=A0A1Y2F3G1_PROLT|nr:major facilitator superfamily domain-containing protein [Protomyces lactucae-debilis]ORY78227.1 major facilitator superfamily domain-containing protein [Protomyces lactucae-debilis]